ncbi:YopX family protein [Clostridium sp.]|uniref:YopX family protein n=1 Tax=Clostridium sp. TaxID=1506 RepID=UPI0035A13A96
MEREIKFRAWDEESELMTDSDYEGGLREFFDHFDDCKLMQYTGLKDKNGKQVYEGDIVKEQRKRFKDKYFAVKWNNDIGSYIFEPLDKSLTSYPCFNIGTVKGLEVIGNIYENPELLEE